MALQTSVGAISMLFLKYMPVFADAQVLYSHGKLIQTVVFSQYANKSQIIYYLLCFHNNEFLGAMEDCLSHLQLLFYTLD